MSKAKRGTPSRECKPIIVISCSENFKRLTKLEYLVILIIRNFRNIGVFDKETKKYVLPTMLECINNFLKTNRFDEVLEVVIQELINKRILSIQHKPDGGYINTKLSDILINDELLDGIEYDTFNMSYKNYQLVDESNMDFKGVNAKTCESLEECFKYKGKQCLHCSNESMLEGFRKFIASKYPGHEDDINTKLIVYKNMVPYSKEPPLDHNDTMDNFNSLCCFE